jgi:hypothetical protein
MFSITQYGKELDKSKYSWNEKTKTLSTTEIYLVLDFSNYDNVTFNTGNYCIFTTGHHCTFTTGHYCTFTTGSSCAFHTSYSCTFKTGDYCTFKTGSFCTFKTGKNCIFHTGYDCTFKTDENCVAIRYDVKGIIEIPKDITIKFNDYGISGYTEVQEDKSKSF